MFSMLGHHYPPVPPGRWVPALLSAEDVHWLIKPSLATYSSIASVSGADNGQIHNCGGVDAGRSTMADEDGDRLPWALNTLASYCNNI